MKLHSTVIFCKNFEEMVTFYTQALKQEVEVDFGNCIGFTSKLSLWKLSEEYPIAQQLGHTFSPTGNKNMEICFDTEEFSTVVDNLKKFDINYLHQATEETWGQMTVRFYDPEHNLIEVGETVPCFVRRFYEAGLTLEEVSKRTHVPLKMVKDICQAL